MMDNSPFRRIVLPALLASSAGFAALTWPMASDRAVQVSAQLPQPLSHWVNSALITDQHKEFSIRYIGFAILSSVAIGVGTAKAMRVHQGQVQRRQTLLEQALSGEQPAVEGDRLTINPLEAADAVDRTASASAKGAATVANLDWTSLLHSTPEAQVEAELLSSSMDEHRLYHIQGADRCRCFALAVEGEYYRYYRNCPNLDKTQALIKQLRRQGKAALATRDDSGYVVWVHQPEQPQQAIPWSEVAIRQG